VISLDYRSYMGSSARIWSLRWLFLYLCSYNLDGSVTGTVCSTLRKAWIYHPSLDFDTLTVLGSSVPTGHSHRTKAKRNQSSSRHITMQDLKRFIDTVNSVMRKHSRLTLNRLLTLNCTRNMQMISMDGFPLLSHRRQGLWCSNFLHIWDNMKITIASHVIFLPTKIHLTFRSFDLIVLLWIQVVSFVAFQILQHLLWCICAYIARFAVLFIEMPVTGVPNHPTVSRAT
jgi:hypothetical protein